MSIARAVYSVAFSLVMSCIFAVWSAQAIGYEAPTILAYDEFIGLTPGARALYIGGLIRMIEELEGQNAKNTASAQIPRKLIASVFLAPFLPKAEALGSNSKPVTVIPSKVRCANDNYRLEYFNDHGFQCILKNETRDTDTFDCPRGHKQLNNDPNTCALKPENNNQAVPFLESPRQDIECQPPNYRLNQKDQVRRCVLNDGVGREQCPQGHERDNSNGLCILKNPDQAVPLTPRQNLDRCKPQQCNNAEAIEDLKERAYPRGGDTPELKCINAGVVTGFDFKRRVCPPVLRLTIVPGGPAYTCQPGQTLCMPLVFGVDGEGKGLCVPISNRTTRACDQKRTEAQRAGQWKDLMNPGSDKLREAWNKWAEDLKRLCVTNEETGVYHCTECEILAKYVRQLNQLSNKARGQVCGQISPTKSTGPGTGSPNLTPSTK